MKDDVREIKSRVNTLEAGQRVGWVAALAETQHTCIKANRLP